MSYEPNTIMIDYPNFEIFKSNMCHQLKSLGDFEFMKELLTTSIVEDYWNNQQILEALYLVCMFDTLCEKYHMKTHKKFSAVRSHKITPPVYPLDVRMGLDSKEGCEKVALPIFKEHGIMEVDIYSVC